MNANGTLSLFSAFHLNLAYSSIEAAERPEVVRRCYRPLLGMIRRSGVPLAIEASGLTLETMRTLDPEWIAELARLLAEGRCELLGSGYAQIIGPLVPAELNRRNQLLGKEIYGRLLGVEPKIALVNEQAYAPGLIRHYRDAGYSAIVMEWDNPARNHPDWDPSWRYYPQLAVDPWGGEIELLWNHSIAFQKFQRYAHGELDLDEFIGYLAEQAGPRPRLFPTYGNDAEIFDFRPGRFASEPRLELAEWGRIERLYGELASRDGFELLLPSAALGRDWGAGAGQRLRPESPWEPIPVKKQGKYNITRWALTGRRDLTLNTECFRIYEALRNRPETGDEDWKELCFLWSSDLRTHITAARLEEALERMRSLAARVSAVGSRRGGGPAGAPAIVRHDRLPDQVRVERSARELVVETPALKVALNLRRGLAVRSFRTADPAAPWLAGTLPHGHFRDIRWGADFYTGHLVFEGAGRPKITDLEPVEPGVAYLEQSGRVEITGTIASPLGPVHKRLEIETGAPRLHLEYRLDWDELPAGRLRLGHLTLNPDAFAREGLFFRTHNGGASPDTHRLEGVELDHGEAVSFLVSSSQVLGMTEGSLEVGDDRHVLTLRIEPTVAAVLPMITLRDVAPAYFCRVAFSAREMDDTSRDSGGGPLGPDSRVRLTLSAASV